MIFSLLSSLITFVILDESLPDQVKFVVTGAFFAISFIFLRHVHGGDMLILETVAQNSKLRVIDPLFKIVAVLFTIIILVALNLPITMVVIVFSIIFMFALYEKNSLKIFLDLIKDPLIFVFFGIIGLLVDFSKEKIGLYNIPLGEIYIVITRQSIVQAKRLLAVSFTCVSLLITLGATTPMADVVYALRRLKIPELIIEIMYLTYRYIFSLIYIYNQASKSSKSRAGFDGFKNTVKSGLYIASNLLNKSLNLAFISINAMESRLYDGKIQFLESEFKRDKTIIFFSTYTLILILLIYLERNL